MSARVLYGLGAEFAESEEVLKAAEHAFEEGYRSMEACTPFPVEGLSEAIGFKRDRVPLCALIGGLTGGSTGFFMQYFANVIHYPLNIGGKPYDSWPAFIPITFEMTVLGAAMSAVIGMLVLNGLPQPYHPVFNAPEFQLASRNRFFLFIEARDPRFDLEQTRRFLEGLRPLSVFEVEP